MPYRRAAFTPESLADLSVVIDMVRKELLEDGVFSAAVLDSSPMRIRFTQKAFALAGHGWSDRQIGFMLDRAFRNAASEARYQRAKRVRHYPLKKKKAAASH